MADPGIAQHHTQQCRQLQGQTLWNVTFKSLLGFINQMDYLSISEKIVPTNIQKGFGGQIRNVSFLIKMNSIQLYGTKSQKQLPHSGLYWKIYEPLQACTGDSGTAWTQLISTMYPLPKSTKNDSSGLDLCFHKPFAMAISHMCVQVVDQHWLVRTWSVVDPVVKTLKH